jgi:hypothetical protein
VNCGLFRYCHQIYLGSPVTYLGSKEVQCVRCKWQENWRKNAAYCKKKEPNHDALPVMHPCVLYSTRTSRYITERTKEVYYQCKSLTCSCTFKTVESVDKILCQPIQAQPVDENALPPPKKRTLNRYRRYNSNLTLH